MPSESLKTHIPEIKTQFIPVIFLWIAGVSAAMQFAKFSISYDALLQHYQTGATLTGAALSVVGVAGLVFGVFGGLIASRVGYLKVLMGALFLGGILSFIQATLPPFELIFITRILEGFSQLGVVVSAPTLIAKLSSDKHRSLTMGLWGTFFGVAFAVSGGVGKWTLDNYGMRELFFSHGVLISLMGVVLFVLLRKNPVLDIAPVSANQGSFLRQMLNVYRNPRALLPSTVFLFYTCTLVSLLTYIPRLVSDSTIQALMLVVLPLVSTSGTFIAGALAQYVMKPQRVAMMAYSTVAMCGLILLFVYQEPLWFAFVVGVLILFLGMIPGASLALIPVLARNPAEQAQGYGLIAQFGNLGATIGPPVFATLVTLFGVNGLVSMVLVICALGLSACFLVFRLIASSKISNR
ncbi:CynX/NimT family MFS transporter [Marinomonas sp. 2405UD66-6]|uniref:MFS transporter n=1 Tax=Marinomonas sp. 2405UD66-6 TaxID=3391834 RepID=UPI0039C9FB9C